LDSEDAWRKYEEIQQLEQTNGYLTTRSTSRMTCGELLAAEEKTRTITRLDSIASP
jgi:hypothetical protein